MFNTLHENEVLILIIDIQEKLVKMLNDFRVKENAVKIAKTAEILNLPVIITEQYPKGLGGTIFEIKTMLVHAEYIEKTSFSALNEEKFRDLLKAKNRKQIVIFGIETHICVLQTAFDLLNFGCYEVFVVKDASFSRSENNNKTALKRLRQAGAQIVTVETVLFELLKTSKHPCFKQVQALIK